MRKCLLFLTFLPVLLLMLSCGGNGDSSQTSRSLTETEKVHALIDTALVYIDHEDFEGLVAKVYSPEDMEMMQFQGNFGRVVRRYSMFRKEVSTALREARAMEPTFEADSMRAVFEVENAPTDLVFKKIDSMWYFGD